MSRSFHPRRIVRTLLVLLALSCLAVVAAQEAPREGITVRGHGTVYGEPDEAVLQVGVEFTDPEARTLIESTSEAMRGVQEALRDAGVEERDIRTVTFDLYQEEPQDREGTSLPARYRLVHLVEVTVREVDDVGEILSVAVEAGADRIGGVRFGLSDASALEAQARRGAVEEARDKAAQLAQAAGRTLGEVLRIDELGDAPASRAGFESRALTMESSAPVASGSLAVRVDVSVVYALE